MADTVAIDWINDEVGLTELANELKIHASSVVIPVNKINRQLSAENRARKEPLDQEKVEAISFAYKKNLPMPKIFVRKVLDEYVIAGGNHRFNGLPNGTLSIPVHCFECTDAEFEIAVVLLNGYVGDGLKKSYRIERAADAFQRLGMGQKQAAKAFGVSVHDIQEEVKHRAVLARLHAMPQRMQIAMTPSHVRAIGDLAKNDNVLKAACIAVANSRTTVKEITELAKEARALSTEDDQVSVFAKFTRLNGSEANNKPVPRKLRNSFLKSCQGIKALKENKTWQSLEFSSDQIAEAKTLAMEVINILSYLCRANG